MSIAVAPDIDSLLLDRVITGSGAPMPHAVAQEVLQWGFSEDDHQRMVELAAKARRGELTDVERAEIESFERVGSFLGVVKSKARRSLQQVRS